VCVCACAYVYACACVHVFKMRTADPLSQQVNVCMPVFMRMCVCVCVCVIGGTYYFMEGRAPHKFVHCVCLHPKSCPHSALCNLLQPPPPRKQSCLLLLLSHLRTPKALPSPHSALEYSCNPSTTQTESFASVVGHMRVLQTVPHLQPP